MKRNVILMVLCIFLTGCATSATQTICKTRLQSHQKWLSEDKFYSIYQSGWGTGKHDAADPDCNLIRISREMIAKGYPYFSIEGRDIRSDEFFLDEKTFVAGTGFTSVGYRQRPQKGEPAEGLSIYDEGIFDARKTIDELSNKLGPYKPCKGDLQYQDCRHSSRW